MRSITRALFVAGAVLSLLFAVGGCGAANVGAPERHEGGSGYQVDRMPTLSPALLGEGHKLRVVATTSIVADVVQQVGADLIDLTRLMPPGTDPHTFEPTPQDVTAVSDAHVVFVNGAGLEVFLQDLLESVGEESTVVSVSSGVEFLQFAGQDRHEEEPEQGGHQHNDVDPHVWFDPGNVILWTRNIERALRGLDPANAEAYAANAEAYAATLEELDGWIREQVARVPQENRELVTDHTSFTYFCDAYGFEQVGALIPGYSTLAEPSARELAALEEAIERLNVRVVFVGNTVNPDLAEQVAEDTGIQLVFLYTGSFSEPGGPADDYVSFMRYNVSAIVEASR